MKIYLLRHAQAEHLLENWNKKVSYFDFIKILHRWENVSLTEKGKSNLKKMAETLSGHFDVVFSSPLKRTVETSNIVNIFNRKVYFEEDLREIIVHPPKILKKWKLSINQWIIICVFKSLFTGEFFKILKQAKDLLDLFVHSGSNSVLVISHSARIHSVLFYTLFNTLYVIKKKDVRPGAFSIIEFSLNTSKIKKENRILNLNE